MSFLSDKLETLHKKYQDADVAARELGALPLPSVKGSCIGEMRNESRFFVVVGYRRRDYNPDIGFEVHLFWVWNGNEWKLMSRINECARQNHNQKRIDYTGIKPFAVVPEQPRSPQREELGAPPDSVPAGKKAKWESIEDEINELSHDEIMTNDELSKYALICEFVDQYRAHYRRNRNQDFARNFALNFTRAQCLGTDIHVVHDVQKKVKPPQENLKPQCPACHDTGWCGGRPCWLCGGAGRTI